MQVHENCVNAGGVKEKRKERWKEIILSKIPFHLRQCCRKRTDRAEPIFLNFTGCHFLSKLLSVLSCFLSVPSSPLFLTLSHPESGVKAIYFTSDPLYDCSRFAFMLDGLPKRLSDKAMNTLSGFSLLVSLCLAGQ